MRAVKQEVLKGVTLRPCERCDVCCSFCWSCMRRRSGGSNCCGLNLGDLGLLMRDGSLFRGLNLGFLPGVCTRCLFDCLSFELLSWLGCRLKL